MNRLVINSKTGNIQLNGVELELVKGISIHIDNSDRISVHLDMDVRELEADIQFKPDLKGRIYWEGNALAEQSKQPSESDQSYKIIKPSFGNGGGTGTVIKKYMPWKEKKE